MGTGHHFLDITAAAQTLRAIINIWDLPKVRGFCKAKDIVTKKMATYRMRKDLH